MKVAIVSSTFPPYSGGIGNVAYFNAKELVKLGTEVTVFTPQYVPVNQEVAGLKVIRVKPLFKYGNAAFLPRLKKLLKGYDVVHLHYPFFGGAEIFACKRPKGQRLIIHYHMDVVGEGIFKLIFSLHNRFFLPRIIKKADKVILTSLDYGQNSNIAGLIKKDPNKFVEIPNGVEASRFLPTEDNGLLRQKYELSKDVKIILFVGALDKAHYFKGVEYLLQAVTLLKQADYTWKLVVVGKGDLLDYYRSLANQLLIEKKVIFTGFVSDEELPSYYNLCDVTVLPSVDKSEAFGMVLAEAMACAKPVIASNLAGVRSVVDNTVNGLLIEPKDPTDLAGKINYLLSDPVISKQYGQAGFRKAHQYYDWPVIAQKINQLYLSLQNRNEKK